MARIRTVKPDFFTSEQIVDCSPTARLLFIGMWCFSDDAGIHPASLRQLKMQVFPGDDISLDRIAELVGELQAAKLIIEYQVENKRYWQVTGWHHQKIDRPSFRHPLPDGSTNARRKLDDGHPPEGNGMEEVREKEEENIPQRKNLKTPSSLPPPREGIEFSKSADLNGFDVLRHLSDTGLSEARRRAPGWDVYQLAEDFNASVRAGKLDPPRSADKAFPGWCEKITKGKRL